MSAASTVGLPEPLRLLAPDGTLAEGHVPALTGDALLDAWRAMLRSRVCDERCFSLQRQGRLGTFSPVNGEEAAVVGSAWALEPERDWIVPQYRELPAMLRFGYRLTQAMQYYTGNPAGSRMDARANVLPFQISLAAQLPHAVGLAWGLRHQGLDAVVCTYLGDGASSEGDAHEAMNLAGVRRAPVVFVLKNNGWAISTPVRKQTAAASFAARAAGYGIPGELVDGNDLLAMHDACSRAVARARAGEGPTLIEARTYRMGPHNTSDDPTRYVDAVELEERRALDPVARVRRYLTAEGLIDEDSEQRQVAELRAEFDAAVAEVEAGAQPGVDAVFDHVYARPPARLEQQRREAR
jgi:pyruvate dehydrogenase E1 component alpha subunit